MLARIALIALVLACGACAPETITPHLPGTADARAQGAALASACDGRNGWSDAAPPARIHGNTYYVGTCGISVILITSPTGHVLIDSATKEAAPAILANIRSLGFDPRDIRLIVGSHEHFDHMGGFAALHAATGAPVWTSAAARAAVEGGLVDPADPQFGMIRAAPPVPVDSVYRGEDVIMIGDHAFDLRPVPTPGHTAGGTSWNWQSCEGGKCLAIAYVDSLTAVSREGYRFTDHPERLAPLRASFARVAAMPCDILITPHPDFSDLFERLRGSQPLIDPAACGNLVTAMRARLDARLTQEAHQ